MLSAFSCSTPLGLLDRARHSTFHHFSAATSYDHSTVQYKATILLKDDRHARASLFSEQDPSLAISQAVLDATFLCSQPTRLAPPRFHASRICARLPISARSATTQPSLAPALSFSCFRNLLVDTLNLTVLPQVRFWGSHWIVGLCPRISWFREYLHEQLRIGS